VDVADINQNGIMEIFVTKMNRNTLANLRQLTPNGMMVNISRQRKICVCFCGSSEPSIAAPQLAWTRLRTGQPLQYTLHEVIWDGNTNR
jgi:hypothetical protein